MASSTSSIVDLGMDSQREAEAQLQFQEFSPSSEVAELDVKSFTKEQIHTFDAMPDTPGSDEEGPETELLYERGTQGQKPSHSFWTFEYYQHLFDVSTKQVVDRIIWSMIPWPGTSYLQHYIKPKPDLYGPFWICVTLVFAIAINGNMANYLHTAASGKYQWKYDFHAVSYAATAIFTYAWLLPIALWAFFWWRIGESRLTFLEILCVYGYSLSIYIPVSVFWVIQIQVLRWTLVLVGALLSGSVLVMTVWPVAQKDSRQMALILIITVFGLHLLLAMGFMLYFFRVPDLHVTDSHVVVSVIESTSQALNVSASLRT